MQLGNITGFSSIETTCHRLLLFSMFEKKMSTLHLKPPSAYSKLEKRERNSDFLIQSDKALTVSAVSQGA